MALQPKRPSRGRGINTSLFPPRDFVTAAMHFAMMPTAERYGELVADLATQCRRLGKSQMMRISRAPATDHAWLRGD
jgi:hypothetical protein